MKRLSRKRSSSSVTDGGAGGQKENAPKQSRISSFFKKEPTKMFTSIREAVQSKRTCETDVTVISTSTPDKSKGSNNTSVDVGTSGAADTVGPF